MPSKPKRPCNHPGCIALVDKGYCDKHKKNFEQQRGSAASRGYDRKWQNAVKTFLAKHPFCECTECKETGKITVAEVVDHRIPHKGDPVLFWDKNNWQAMSKKHHNRKTVKEDGGFGRPPRGR